jgi:hypothetical protein
VGFVVGSHFRIFSCLLACGAGTRLGWAGFHWEFMIFDKELFSSHHGLVFLTVAQLQVPIITHLQYMSRPEWICCVLDFAPEAGVCLAYVLLRIPESR